MRRIYQVTGLLIFAGSAYVMVESRARLNYYTEWGPGPGFFPFWCGVLLAVCSLAWLAQVSFRPVEVMPKDFIPSHEGSIRVISAIAALIVLTMSMRLLGFQLPMLAFLFFLLLTLGRQRPVSALVLSVAGSWGMTYLFRNLLDVPLPMSALEVLRNLGL